MAEPDQQAWRVSSYCDSGTCLAVKVELDRIRVRQTDRPGDADLSFEPAVWRAFLDDVKHA